MWRKLQLFLACGVSVEAETILLLRCAIAQPRCCETVAATIVIACVTVAMTSMNMFSRLFLALCVVTLKDTCASDAIEPTSPEHVEVDLGSTFTMGRQNTVGKLLNATGVDGDRNGACQRDANNSFRKADC